MQKTLIDPFELASRTLPSPLAAVAKHAHGEPAPRLELSFEPELPPEEKKQPTRLARSETWLRVRCWCSEE